MNGALRTLVGLSLLACSSIAATTTSQTPSEGEALFVEHVKPLLEQACFKCHGPHAKSLKGGLMMSSHEALVEGGNEGPAIVAGRPSESLLVELLRELDEDYRMPPKQALSEDQIALIERWIELGAPWPGGEAVLRDKRDIDLEAGRQWWSFKPPIEPELPALTSFELAERARNEVDAFVFARLEAAGLKPAAPASDRELVRRLHFDLLGLPPTPERVEQYLNDARADKWERLVDELLATVEYAERQARMWLDVVRFAQTNGYEQDEEKPMSWRYRDYVIHSFYADKPYDRFLLEQLAGDEFEERSQASLIATGFYRLGAWDSEPDNRAQADLDTHDDVLRTIGEGMLGLTVGCARCHDHRTDPIRQQDYYSMLAFVQNVTPYRRPKYSRDSKLLHPFDLTPERLAEHEALRAESQSEALVEADEFLAALLERYEGKPAAPIAASFNRERAKDKEFQAKLSDDDRLQLYLVRARAEELAGSFKGTLKWALTASEHGPEAPPTHVLKRGLVDSPMGEVAPSFPPVLCQSDAESVPTPSVERADSSGRRLQLARWITDPEHPLTARVMVNRLWQGHFGVGICNTPNDLGATGGRPTHPQLLDWLALRFVESGWSVKRLHRRILNSYTYRMASSHDLPRAAELDPSNELLWRQNLRRLDAESLRDASLFVSGGLSAKRGGRGFFPALSREALAGSSKPGMGWEVSSPEQRKQRALYTFVKRGQLDPLLEVFDLANPTMPNGKRAETTVASQALALLNSELFGSCAVEFAARARRERPASLTAQIERLYELALARRPSAAELEFAHEFLKSQESALSAIEPHFLFRARVPNRLEVDYLAALAPEDFSIGPREGWSYVRGRWGLRYNQTEQYDRASGPAALLEAPQVADGEITTSLRLTDGTSFVGLLLRAHATGEAFVGLQVFFDREAGQVLLWQHVAADAAPLELARADFALQDERDYALRIELAGDSVRVSLDGEQVLQHQGTTLTVAGHFGLRTWDAGCELRDLNVAGAPIEVPQHGTSAERALASLALVLLNLNEFMYID